MVLQDPKIRKRHWGISHWVPCKTFQISNSNCEEMKTNFPLLTMVLNKSLLHKKMRNCDIQSYNIHKSSTNIILDSKLLFPKHPSEMTDWVHLVFTCISVQPGRQAINSYQRTTEFFYCLSFRAKAACPL